MGKKGKYKSEQIAIGVMLITGTANNYSIQVNISSHLCRIRWCVNLRS